MRRFVHVNCVILLVAAAATHSIADEALKPKTEGRVIGRIWTSKTDATQLMRFSQQLAKELGVKNRVSLPPVFSSVIRATRPGAKARTDVKGTLVVLETSPNAGTPHLVSFQKVRDKAHFQELVKQEAARMGSMAELIGDDDRYELRMKIIQLNVENLRATSPRAGDGEKPVANLRSIAILRVDTGSARIAGAGDGDDLLEMSLPSRVSTWIRYHDGFMYSSQQEAVHHVRLPAGTSMLPDEESAAFDVYGELDFREIPSHLKQLAWQMWRSKAMTWMQRFDRERPGTHAVRHALGEGRIELMKTLLFDVDTAQFSVNFPEANVSPGDPPGQQPNEPFSVPSLPDTGEPVGSGRKELTASVTVSARENSQLAATLDQLNRTPSRLGALRDETAPLVISSSLDLPDWSLPLVSGLVSSVRTQLLESTSNSGAGLLLEDVFRPLEAAAETGSLDLAVRMDRDDENGLVLVGGLRLPDAEQFRSSLDLLLLAGTDAARFSVTRSKPADVEITTLGSDAIKLPFLAEAVPGQLHVAATGSYLWFALGGPGSRDALNAQLEQRESVYNAQTESLPLLVRLNLSDWLGDYEGASRAPQMLLTELERKINGMFSGMNRVRFLRMSGVTTVKSSPPGFQSYAAKTLKPDSASFELAARTHGRTLTVDSTIDSGVLKFLLAQYAAAQSRMFSGITFGFSPTNADGETREYKSLQLRAVEP